MIECDNNNFIRVRIAPNRPFKTSYRRSYKVDREIRFRHLKPGTGIYSEFRTIPRIREECRKEINDVED
jgi:hypothetical protein